MRFDERSSLFLLTLAIKTIERVMNLLIVPWDVNPEIFRIGSFAVRWYGLLFASSFLFGYFIMEKFFKNEKIPVETLDKLTIYMAIGVIVGPVWATACFMNHDFIFPIPLKS